MVPPVSHRVSRVPWYSGSSPLEIDFRLPGSHRLWQAFPGLSANQFPLLDCPQPQRINPLVWPLPRSLATTSGISVDFSSSPYLDVSVQAVPYLRLFDSTQVDRVLLCRVSPFGNLRINGHLHLPEAYRSLSRPSSAPDAKAFPLRSFALDLIFLLPGRSRSGSQAFELCRLRVLRNCFVLPFRKVPQIIFVSLCCLLFILGYFVQFSRCVSSFFRNQIQTLNPLNACIQSHTISLGPVPDGTRGVPRTSVLAKPKPCRRGNSFAPRMSHPLWGSPFDGNQMGWWAQVDSNHRPHDYQSCALAS